MHKSNIRIPNVLLAGMLALASLPAAWAEEPQRQSSQARRYLEQAFGVGFRVEVATVEKVELHKKGPIEGKASAMVASRLLNPLVDGDPRVAANLLPLDGELVGEVLVQVDAAEVDGGIRVWVERADGSREPLRLRPPEVASSRTVRGGFFQIGDGAKLIVATSKPHEVDVSLETRLTSRRADYRDPKARRVGVMAIEPGRSLPSMMCREDALQEFEDARNSNPRGRYEQALAEWQEKARERESCRRRQTDQLKVELGVTELDDARKAALEPVLEYVCDPGEKPDSPVPVELSMSEATRMVVDGRTYAVGAAVKARPGLVVKQVEDARRWQEFVRAPGHPGRLQCFIDEKRGDERVTLPVVRWDAGMWRFLRSQDETLSGDLDRDLLPNWLDPDANGDGVLDLAQRLGIEMPEFESTLRYEDLELP